MTWNDGDGNRGTLLLDDGRTLRVAYHGAVKEDDPLADMFGQYVTIWKETSDDEQ